MAVPRSSSLSRGSHTHVASVAPVTRVEKTHLARRLLGGNLSGTTALGVRGGDDDSGGAHGKHLFAGFVFAGFVKWRPSVSRLGSARLHPPRAGASSFGDVSRDDDVRDYWEMIHVVV